MSAFFEAIRTLIADERYEVTHHAFFKLDKDRIVFADVLAGMVDAVVEEYPDYHKGQCVLAKLKDSFGAPIHAVWGLADGTVEPAFLVTVYRPDPARWAEDFTKRMSR